MPNTPYTQKEAPQYRGPQSSEKYNLRIEDNFRDLVYLYNRRHQDESAIRNGLTAILKDLESLTRYVSDLSARIDAFEGTAGTVSFFEEAQIDNDRFNSTAYAVTTVDRCAFHGTNTSVTLPVVENSSVSKVKFTGDDGQYSIAPSMEIMVTPVNTTAETGAVIETSQPLNALLGRPGQVWERNVVVNSPDTTNGAQMYLYVRIPNELSATDMVNSLKFTPFPLYSVDILEISYSTDANVTLSSTANWKKFNATQAYFDVDEAAGNLIPGAWSGDAILKSTPKLFYFDPMPITALRFKLRQKNYYTENAKSIYTYGMSQFDVRYDKFLDSGRTIVRFDAMNGTTISAIDSVTPQIWNVPEYLIDDVFSYRIIWETSYNSGTYTLNPVALSQRVWMEITLNKTPNGGTPMLSGVILKYS